jgi:hypothetical protein
MKPSYNSIIVNSRLQSQAHDLNPSQGEGLNLGCLNLGELKIIDIKPHVTMPNILWVGAQREAAGGGGGKEILGSSQVPSIAKWS